MRPVDAVATEEADIMGAERIEPFMRRVSRRSVVGAGAKLAYASPLVAASFSLSPAFGYMRAAAYFGKKKRAKKPAPEPGSDPRPNPNPEAQSNPDSTGEPCDDPTTGVIKPEDGVTGGGNAGHNKKGNKKGKGDKNGHGNENNGGSGRFHSGGDVDCDDPQSGGSKGDGKPKGKGNSGGGTEPDGQVGQGSGAGNAGKRNQGKRSRSNQRGRHGDSVTGGQESPGSDPGADPTGNEFGSGDQTGRGQSGRGQAGDGQRDGQGGTADGTGGDSVAGGQGTTGPDEGAVGSGDGGTGDSEQGETADGTSSDDSIAGGDSSGGDVPDAGGAPDEDQPGGDGTDPIPPPSDGSPDLPTIGDDGRVNDAPTPTDAGGSEVGDTGDDPKFSVAKVVICHAVCTKKDPHRPLAYRLIELADDPDAWDTHVTQDHGKRMCAKDEDVILGPVNQGYTEKDCPGNRISGP